MFYFKAICFCMLICSNFDILSMKRANIDSVGFDINKLENCLINESLDNIKVCIEQLRSVMQNVPRASLSCSSYKTLPLINKLLSNNVLSSYVCSIDSEAYSDFTERLFSEINLLIAIEFDGKSIDCNELVKSIMKSWLPFEIKKRFSKKCIINQSLLTTMCTCVHEKERVELLQELTKYLLIRSQSLDDIAKYIQDLKPFLGAVQLDVQPFVSALFYNYSTFSRCSNYFLDDNKKYLFITIVESLIAMDKDFQYKDKHVLLLDVVKSWIPLEIKKWFFKQCNYDQPMLLALVNNYSISEFNFLLNDLTKEYLSDKSLKSIDELLDSIEEYMDTLTVIENISFDVASLIKALLSNSVITTLPLKCNSDYLNRIVVIIKTLMNINPKFSLKKNVGVIIDLMASSLPLNIKKELFVQCEIYLSTLLLLVKNYYEKEFGTLSEFEKLLNGLTKKYLADESLESIEEYMNTLKSIQNNFQTILYKDKIVVPAESFDLLFNNKNFSIQGPSNVSFQLCELLSQLVAIDYNNDNKQYLLDLAIKKQLSENYIKLFLCMESIFYYASEIGIRCGQKVFFPEYLAVLLTGTVEKIAMLMPLIQEICIEDQKKVHPLCITALLNNKNIIAHYEQYSKDILGFIDLLHTLGACIGAENKSIDLNFSLCKAVDLGYPVVDYLLKQGVSMQQNIENFQCADNLFYYALHHGDLQTVKFFVAEAERTFLTKFSVESNCYVKSFFYLLSNEKMRFTAKDFYPLCMSLVRLKADVNVNTKNGSFFAFILKGNDFFMYNTLLEMEAEIDIGVDSPVLDNNCLLHIFDKGPQWINIALQELVKKAKKGDIRKTLPCLPALLYTLVHNQSISNDDFKNFIPMIIDLKLGKKCDSCTISINDRLLKKIRGNGDNRDSLERHDISLPVLILEQVNKRCFDYALAHKALV